MNWPMVIAGVLFLIWPLTYRHQIGKIHDKLVARGEDPARFDRAMSRPVFRASMWLIPVLGVGVLVAGLTGS